MPPSPNPFSTPRFPLAGVTLTSKSSSSAPATPSTSGDRAPKPTWQELVARKQQQSYDAIPKEWRIPESIMSKYERPFADHQHRFMDADIPRASGILNDRELDITEKYTVRTLLEAMVEGQLSALEVTVAFCKRAAIAQQLTSCLTEIFFDEAQKRAQQLDDLKAKGKLAGPLHGLPISVKDGFKIIGQEATIGYVGFIGDKATTNSVLVSVLLELGAVLYVKTNIPQTLMTADSENNIFGRTVNPWNTYLNAGGSSGGEGALVAMRGSPIGVGTDIAGSIRIPSLCCGTYGFKPSAQRIPYAGQAYGIKPGMRFIHACAGPIANDMDALEIFTKAVIDAEPARYDSDTFDIPWRTTTRITGKRKLRIGLLPEDPHFPLHPPVRRALSEAAAKLQESGHDIIKMDIAKCHISAATEIAWLFFGLDPFAKTHIEKAGEPFVRSIAQTMEAFHQMDIEHTNGIAQLERLDRLAALNVKRTIIAEDWRQMWTSYDIDAVLGPSAQNTAVEHDTFGLPPYTVLFNILDYPSCVIPYQKSRPELDPEPMSMGEAKYGPTYDPAAMAGAPCSIQVFTSKLRDEECLAVARIVDECLHTTS